MRIAWNHVWGDRLGTLLNKWLWINYIWFLFFVFMSNINSTDKKQKINVNNSAIMCFERCSYFKLMNGSVDDRWIQTFLGKFESNWGEIARNEMNFDESWFLSTRELIYCVWNIRIKALKIGENWVNILFNRGAKQMILMCVLLKVYPPE